MQPGGVQAAVGLVVVIDTFRFDLWPPGIHQRYARHRAGIDSVCPAVPEAPAGTCREATIDEWRKRYLRSLMAKTRAAPAALVFLSRGRPLVRIVGSDIAHVAPLMRVAGQDRPGPARRVPGSRIAAGWPERLPGATACRHAVRDRRQADHEPSGLSRG